jgi:hypothetical protein
MLPEKAKRPFLIKLSVCGRLKSKINLFKKKGKGSIVFLTFILFERIYSLEKGMGEFGDVEVAGA